jgi:hypothetical protein
VFERPVLILGAGATKACGGPLTDELLPAMLEAFREGQANGGESELDLLAREFREFLRSAFHLPVDDDWRLTGPASLPALPLLLSLMDAAVDRGQPLGAFAPERIALFKRVVQAGVYASLVSQIERRREPGRNAYERLLEPFYASPNEPQPTVVTLNYDTLVDRAMADLGAARGLPDFGCDIVLPSECTARFGRLLKLHGSLSWLHCRRCSRLSLHMSGLRKSEDAWGAFADMFEDLAPAAAFEGDAECPECGEGLEALLITPSNSKSYSNPHVSRIWYETARALRRADRVVFVGYSLPWDDVEVIYLLKQNLEHLAPERITVVEYSKTGAPINEHDAGKRYSAVFGPKIDWQPLGFTGWLDACAARGEGLLALPPR